MGDPRVSTALLDSLPYPALIISRHRMVLAANQAAQGLGARVGTLCWDTFGQRVSISRQERDLLESQDRLPPGGIRCHFCLADQALQEGQPLHQEVKSGHSAYDAWWVPLGPDLFLHYATDQTAGQKAAAALQRDLAGPAQEGRPRPISAVIQDIAQRQRDEDALRQSQERYRLLFELSGDSIFIIEAEGPEAGRILEANPAAAQNHGYTVQELLGRKIFELDTPQSAAQSPERIERLLAGQWLKFEVEHYHKDGTTLPMEVTAGCFQHQGRRLIMAFDRDISQRKRAEAALRGSEEKLRLITDHIHDWEYWIGPGLELLFVSPSSLEVTGYQPQEFVSDRGLLDRIVHPQDQELWRQHRAAISAGEGLRHPAQSLELRIITKEGQQRWIAHHCRPVFGLTGEFLGRRVSNRDVTQRKREEEERAQLEAQLRQAQKMEAIGTLAGGIAHDFNNILAAILGFAELALSDAQSGRINPPDLEQIIKAAQRARRLVQQILTFSRKVEPQRQPLDLNHEVRRSLELLRHTLPKMIATQVRLAPNLPRLEADPGQLSQVIINLAANAYQAMPEGGQIAIATDFVHVDGKVCATCGQAFSGNWVTLAVSDTGQGVPAQLLPRIFDPFFTTKEVGQGTGLGLSMVHGIIQSHGGHIECQSVLGQGTTFTTYLAPSQSGESLPAQACAEPGEIPGGRETILLVDDEESLRLMGRRLLAEKGYQVLTAKSGEEALERLRQTGVDIDLVVMDLGMPGMGGHKALKQILAMSPQARVLIASGYASKDQVQAALSSGAVGFLAKPFTGGELMLAVRQALDGG